MLVHAAVVHPYVCLLGVADRRDEDRPDDQLLLELFVKLLLGLHVRLPLVGLRRQVANEHLPNDRSKQLHLARDSSERERAQHRNRHLALIEHLEEVDSLFFDFDLANAVELRVAKEMCQ